MINYLKNLAQSHSYSHTIPISDYCTMGKTSYAKYVIQFVTPWRVRSLINYWLVFLLLVLSLANVSAQKVAWGGTLRHDLYNRYANPSDEIASRSAGSAILNIGLGPKIWVGDGDMSISTEASFMFSPLALSTGDYKGMGAISFPLIVKLEFFGNSNFNREGKFGFSIGGGLQYTKTELWYLKESFEKQGVSREYFKTYVIEADFGYGVSGFDAHLFVRYGWSNDTDANTLNIGMGYDFNIPKLKKAIDPEF